MTDKATRYLEQAVMLAHRNVQAGGRPFGAVVVRGGEVLATGVNETVATHDPTAHAELVALRAAAQRLGSADLSGCAVYASGQPCPMCLAAMRLAGVAEVHFAYSNQDGAPYGLSTAALYEELAKPLAQQSMTIRHRPLRPQGMGDLYADWKARQDRA
ncbi:tRNA(Arg) A34 adenosine deaminase TadA [Paracoccus pantotrophus]|uniref:Nucleoside deaminase n=1 Tax=Paracoccus pantotrophus TaxID=82367 RepID=A0AAE6NRU2_PARPN|nr:nucleoside deaminase [Paracoccus pantotrophus]QFG35139.1 nucleoside deaminase [Paracoccus pantotrophus]RKS44677.1 tRNA(Arg) A34 adenosine deaminase TadA [Paracoccus pantotrophus]